MWTPKERSPIAQTWLWGQHPAECPRLLSRTWGRRAGRRDPALRPGGGGVSRARGPGRHFPACRAARTLGLSGPSGRPAPAHPVSPAARAWRPAEERRRLARYAVAWPGGRAGGDSSRLEGACGRARAAGGDYGDRPGARIPPGQAGAGRCRFSWDRESQKQPGRSEAHCWLWDVKSFFRSELVSKLPCSSSGGAAGSLV